MIRRLVGRNAAHLLRNPPLGSRIGATPVVDYIAQSIGEAQLPGSRIGSRSIDSMVPWSGAGARLFAKAPRQQPIKVDEFQHEEITGPTVERDLSATANELRESIDSMLQSNVKLKRALIAVGLAQLIAGWWVIASDYSAETLCLCLTALSAGLSLHLALHLHTTMKHVPFFQKVEERSRMRIMTLSMQTIKAVALMMSRSNVITRCTAIGLLGACLYEAVQPKKVV
ncbi:uncharacterized protein LOC112347209 [Selaginella moellendorffii]|uniref:uncharacterized protein LOC112347209 n=1 Tax=Selaginella moellendorffii TaxID=88036 RepID=UPI000D1CF1CA|nr:uncharacterized protein LOC112347209 [Selaginella moellendorffii]|eukprot:XP_024533479.1 uncharacterized protein LOC112347209 [Selaginella moellendorffii]